MPSRSGASRPDLNTSRWQTVRQQVRMRDRNRCVGCGATEKLSVHHVVKAKDGGRDVLDNLVTLCVRCHRRADARGSLFLSDPVTPRAFGGNPPLPSTSRAVVSKAEQKRRKANLAAAQRIDPDILGPDVWSRCWCGSYRDPRCPVDAADCKSG